MNVISHALKHHIDWSGAFHFEWYNHLCDLYYQFPIGNNLHWIERVVFSNFVIKETVHTDRHNFYFFASDEFLPFSSI